jgi:hypothetical protein
MSSLSDFQCELNFASGGNGIRRLHETTCQADATNYPGYTRFRADYNTRRYPAAQTTETPSFHLATIQLSLRL